MSEPFNIVTIRENPLLKRREVVLEITHQGTPTPTRQAVREFVAGKLGVSPNLVFIRRISTQYGAGKSVAEVHVYNEAEVAKIVEPLYILARNLGEEGKKLLEEARKKRNERREKKKRKKK